ncbi:M20 aminoacylase family protein [Acinetobacter nosocomialis]|uniref:M20 aminoacylase family protein n=1 Tax=Acinetobacter nosocomialis TaxID=106654 RepID=UPI0026F430F0|nr:M20 aminoacylase family protein [Acinetobacter nosocomialis]MDO7435638.1 M20 aminoacylase family protein [Acinetobacter nosocomialis]
MSLISFEEQLHRWRHELHSNPETGFEEITTAEYIAQQLKNMGLDVHTGIGGTGIIASLTVGNNPTVIGLRADMDALNITETTGKSYCSKNHGKMHACGHDGHMSMLLGAAKLLTENRNFNGTVRFVFQPAEEHGRGAKAMMSEGLLERFPIDEFYGVHNWPGLPAGSICTRVGGIMASEDNFTIKIKGKGTHAARPHMGKDPLVIAAEIILALQTIISRNLDPSVPAVISCTEIHTDGIRNAIPSNAVITGDTRSYSPDVQAMLENRMRTICESICKMHDAECEFEYTHEFSPTVNHATCVNTAVNAAINIVGESKVDANVQAMMASEDFGAFIEKVPGCFAFIGNGVEEDGKGFIPLHNSNYDINDDILSVGAQYFAEIIRTRLPL